VTAAVIDLELPGSGGPALVSRIRGDEQVDKAARLASLHHERLNGTGYHRGSGAAALPPAARLLAAADVCQALREARPHRAAHGADEAATQLRAELPAARA
jgi:HD-GYP domain-containing protein (c-di-GMP phosphodiesterase class II)